MGGYSNNNDFWVNLSQDGDDKVKAKIVQGPTFDLAPLGSQTGSLGDAKDVVASYDEGDYKLSLDQMVLTAADSEDSDQQMCTRFSDEKGNVMYKIDCPKVCKKSDIASKWQGSDAVDSDGNEEVFDLDLNENGQGTWNGKDISWSYDSDLPDAGLTIEGWGSKYHLVAANNSDGNQTCDTFVGQTSPSGHGPAINGVTMRIDKKSKQ